VREDDAYLVRLEADDGTSFELLATVAQLDSLAEDIDRQLNADEEVEAD